MERTPLVIMRRGGVCGREGVRVYATTVLDDVLAASIQTTAAKSFLISMTTEEGGRKYISTHNKQQ